MPSSVRNGSTPDDAEAHGQDPAGAPTWYVKRLHLRRLLPERGREALEAASTSLVLPRRALLFDPGSAGDELWWLEEGRVRLSHFLADGREIAVAVLEEGELLGLEPRPPFAVARALAEVIEAARLRRCPRSRFEEILDDHPEGAATLGRQVARQLGLDPVPAWAGERRPSETERTERIATLRRDPPARGGPAPATTLLALLVGVGREEMARALASPPPDGGDLRS